MKDVLLNIKTDHNTKEHLKSFAEELGISMTAFINMLVKQALRERRVVLSTTLRAWVRSDGVISSCKNKTIAALAFSCSLRGNFVNCLSNLLL